MARAGGTHMSQVTINLDDNTERKMNQVIEKNGVSKSWLLWGLSPIRHWDLWKMLIFIQVQERRML